MTKKTTPLTPSLTTRERLKKLYIDFNLTREDIFTHDKFNYVMMTRTGVEKIQAKLNINIKYEVIKCEPKFCVVKAIATKGEYRMETFGTANADNCRISYFAEMAEKRSKARCILLISGFYSVGVYSEVEADDFSRNNSNNKPQNTGISDEVNKLNSQHE